MPKSLEEAVDAACVTLQTASTPPEGSERIIEALRALRSLDQKVLLPVLKAIIAAVEPPPKVSGYISDPSQNWGSRRR